MNNDVLVRRANGRPESLGWQFARRRAEKKLWSAFRSGQQVDLSPNGQPGRGGRAATGRATVRADVIMAMLRGGPGPGHGARLTIRGARITGQLDLSYARIDHPITLRDCVFEQPIALAEARLGTLTLDGSSVPGIQAPNLEVDGDLGLSHVSASGTVQLSGAHLHRNLRLDGADLSHGEDQEDALTADHLVVEGSVACGGLEAAGSVNLAGARVSGAVRLEGAKITAGGRESVAFDGDGIAVGQDFNARGLAATGEVTLVDARIASTLEFQGATLVNPDGVALRFDRAEISSSLYCADGFTAEGGIQGIGAHVGGSVYLNDAELGRPGPDSGEAAASGGPALILVRTRIDGDFGCWGRFVVHDTIDLTRLSVGGEFRLTTTGLNGRPTAADLTNGRFGTLVITGDPPAGFLDLTKAEADFFRDGAAARWRADGDVIILDEFEYRTIQMTKVTVEEREQWLRRAMEASRRKSGYAHDGYLPQPYEQLAAAYVRAGDDRAARRIQLAKHRQRNRSTKWDRWYTKLWNILQDVLVGYGYEPGRALGWLAGLFVLGLLLFRYVAKPYSIVSVPHPSFALANSAGYTLNLLLPASGLEERQAWQSAGLGEVAAAGLVVFGLLLTATVFTAVARVLQRN
ncbi:MAG: hypothetical protein LBV78_06615 [Kitasatospora sp.]|nr:hypothetical protein [Kitasatospora sp.]